MVLMELFGVAFAYSVLKGASSVAEAYGKKAYPDLDNDKYDKENMRDGIMPHDILRIAARNGVRPDKNGVLPLTGYRHCLNYVRKYANDPSDVDKFIHEWKRRCEYQQKEHSHQLKRESEQNYNDIVEWFESTRRSGRTITLTYNHWRNLTEAEHNERVYELYNKTYLGERAVRPPVVRFDPDIYGKRIEVWVVESNTDEFQDDRQTMAKWNRLYANCCKHLGYEPNL